MRTIILAFAALLGLLAQPGMAQVYDPYTGPDPVAPSLRLMAEPFAAAEALGPVSVSIRSLNAQTFPFVFLDVDATDETGTCPVFTAENFQVLEDGVAQTDYFAVTPPHENQGVRLVDIVFIMDNSGSMGDDQLAVRNNVYGFVDKLTQVGVNFAFGLTRYGQGASSGAPLIQDNGNLTSDAAYFKDTVWTRNTIDGGTEPGYWSIVESAAKFNYRPGSRRVFIIITDENPNQGGATLDQAAAALESGDVTLFAVTETGLFASFQTLVADPTEQLLGLTTSFDQIFTVVTDLLADTYRVTYRAQNETIDGLERTVEVQVTCGADTGSDITTYSPGSEPRITRTQETVALSETTQPQQMALTIAAQVTDQAEPFVQPGGVMLYYRPTSTDSNAPYKSVTMTSIGTDTYSAKIPAEDVRDPGIAYYISATDGVSTATSPTSGAAKDPFTISVDPNNPPVLNVDSATEAFEGTQITLSVEAFDSTDYLNSVVLAYRKRGELMYKEKVLCSFDGNSCGTSGTELSVSTFIPSGEVTLQGVEYFIVASDNYGSERTFGSADSPMFVQISELRAPFKFNVYTAMRLATAAYKLSDVSPWREGPFTMDQKLPTAEYNSLFDNSTDLRVVTDIADVDSQGFFIPDIGDNAAALVSRTEDALIISFRGTNDNTEKISAIADSLKVGVTKGLLNALSRGLSNAAIPAEQPYKAFLRIAAALAKYWPIKYQSPDVADWLMLTKHWAKFADLMAAIPDYCTAHGIKKVYFTGHSLGGSMVQNAMIEHPPTVGASIDFSAYAFAPPGIDYGTDYIGDPRLLNVIFENDPIRGADIFTKRTGDTLVIDSAGTGGHDKALYLIATEILLEGGFVTGDRLDDPGNPGTELETRMEEVVLLLEGDGQKYAVGGVPGSNLQRGVFGTPGNDDITIYSEGNKGQFVIGRKGNDTIDLSIGKDILVFRKGDGQDTVEDFNLDEDLVVLYGFDTPLDRQIVEIVFLITSDTTVLFRNGDSIKFKGRNLAEVENLLKYNVIPSEE